MTARRAGWIAGPLAVLVIGRVASAQDAAERARTALRDVLVRPEFGPLAEADRIPVPDVPDVAWLRGVVRWFAEALGWVADGIGSVLRWIFNALRSVFGGWGGGSGSGETTLATYAVWVLCGLALALVIWILLRASGRRRLAARSALVVEDGAVEVEDDALSRSPEAWRREAAGLAGSGRHREALRALYLALLADLHRRGAIEYDRTRTNTAYVRDVPARHAAFEPLRRLTLRFDRVWYGDMALGQEELRRSEHDADAVRRAFDEEGRHG